MNTVMTRQTILIDQLEDSIGLECEGCGSEFRSGGFHYDKRFDPLYRTLRKSLVLPGMKRFDIKDGEIKGTAFVSVDEPV